MDNNVREVRDHPTLEGGEYDHEIYALSEDVPPSEGAPPSVAQKAILVGPADVVGTLWRTNLCAILETRGKLRGGFSISGPRHKGGCSGIPALTRLSAFLGGDSAVVGSGVVGSVG